MNKCFICLDDNNVLEAYELPCSHKFCKECLQGYFITKIKSGSFNQGMIQCPSCSNRFDSNLLRDILTPKQFDWYCERTIELNIPLGLNENEVMVHCPNQHCQNGFIIWKEADYYTCPSCQIKYCRQCSQRYHVNLTCQQNKQMQTYSRSILKFKKQTKDTVKECPHCFQMIEKTKGCNFMTCESNICLGDKYFCFECEIPLTYNDEFSHYEGRDPFGGKCLVKDNGMWIVKKVVPVTNAFPCPNCQTKDPQKCHIEPNFNQKAAYCICSNKTYCLNCKQQLTDDLLLEHLKLNFQCKFVAQQPSKCTIF